MKKCRHVWPSIAYRVYKIEGKKKMKEREKVTERTTTRTTTVGKHLGEGASSIGIHPRLDISYSREQRSRAEQSREPALSGAYTHSRRSRMQIATCRPPLFPYPTLSCHLLATAVAKKRKKEHISTNSKWQTFCGKLCTRTDTQTNTHL